jgi:hypothetical protein
MRAIGVALRAGTVTRVWPWPILSKCRDTGGKIVCTR